MRTSSTTTATDDLLAAPLGLQLLELIPQSRSESLSDGELTGLLTQLDFHVSRFQGDYDQQVAALKSKAQQLRTLGDWLPRRMPGWWDEIDRVEQVWVGSLNAPVEGRLEVDLSQFDSETPKPRKALWTCTRIPTLVSPWLESSEKQFRGPEKIWKLTVSEKARVAEIHSAAAWFRFVRAYMRDQVGYTYSTMLPRPQSAARVDPDWSKVALDWDGVHLSVGGWLTAEDVTYESDRVTTELRGWNMESTVWFRWAFTAVEPIEMAT